MCGGTQPRWANRDPKSASVPHLSVAGGPYTLKGTWERAPGCSATSAILGPAQCVVWSNGVRYITIQTLTMLQFGSYTRASDLSYGYLVNCKIFL